MQALRVSARKEKLDEVTGFLDAFLNAHDCPAKARMQLELAVEELFVNVASYAYPNGAGEAELRLSAENGILTLTLIDAGVPYDPLRNTDPDVTLSADTRAVGGLGVFLVKKNMDAVSYRYENGKNVFTAEKRIK